MDRELLKLLVEFFCRIIGNVAFVVAAFKGLGLTVQQPIWFWGAISVGVICAVAVFFAQRR